MSFLIGMGIAALIGAGMGAASYAAGQLIECAFTGTFEWSWGGFFGAAVGGAIGGALVYAFGITGGWGAFASGAVTSIGTMTGENITGCAEYSILEIIGYCLIQGGLSALSVNIANAHYIPGLNVGRGSYKAVSNQIYTKFHRQMIKRIAIKTFGKMLAYEAYCDAFSSFMLVEKEQKLKRRVRAFVLV